MNANSRPRRLLAIALLILVAADAAAAQRLRAGRRNAMAGDAAKRPGIDLVMTWKEIREQTDFVGHPIGELVVLNTRDADPALLAPDAVPDLSLDAEIRRREKRGFVAVANGTFFDVSTRTPAGSVMRAGGNFERGVVKADERGSVAVLADGTLLLGLSKGGGLQRVEARFGAVAAFMGGGALLVENGRKIGSDDLETDQLFDQVDFKKCRAGEGGLAADQFWATNHTLIAVRDGQAYLLVNEKPMDGATLQTKLRAAGFTTAVKFDGGSKCFYDDGGLSKFRRPVSLSAKSFVMNPVGFAVKPVVFHVVCEAHRMKVAKEKPDDVTPEEFFRSLTPADIEIVPREDDGIQQMTVLEVDATALSSEYRAILRPGTEFVFPLSIDGSVLGPEGKSRELKGTIPMPLRVISVHRSSEDALEVHGPNGLKDPRASKNREMYEALFCIHEASGAARYDAKDDKFSGALVGGPLEAGWTRAHKAAFIDVLPAMPELAICFVTTAVYGDPRHPTIERLRRFRDDVLASTPAGRRAIEAYYRHGPSWARRLRGRPLLRRLLAPVFDGLAAMTESTDWSSHATRGGLDLVLRGVLTLLDEDEATSAPMPDLFVIF